MARVVNLDLSEVRDPDHAAPIPVVPSTLQEVVALVARAVDRPSAQVAEVLRGASPRLSHRRSLLWLAGYWVCPIPSPQTTAHADERSTSDRFVAPPRVGNTRVSSFRLYSKSL